MIGYITNHMAKTKNTIINSIKMTPFCICFLFIFFSVNAFASESKIEFFSPQGEVKDVRQVTVRFSEEMVSFGDIDSLEPFDIKCESPGKGRWADGKNWIYDFDKELKAGIKCTFSLKKQTRTKKGAEIKGQRVFNFSTGGPQVVSIHPGDGSEYIDEEQVFIIKPDGDIQEESVIKNVFCLFENTKERVGIKLLPDQETQKLLHSLYAGYGKKENKHVLALQCKRKLPNNLNLSIVWGKGILSKSGVPSNAEQVFHYKTRKPFTASFICHRENPKSGCIALLPMSIHFSSPVAKKIAENITIKGGKKAYKPVFENHEKDFVTRVIFKGPFPEKTSFTVNLPTDMKDDAGRPLSNQKSFALKVKTDRYPPLAKFSSRFGIIERDDPILPVTVRNIEPYLKGKIVEIPKDGGVDEAPSMFDKKQNESDKNKMEANSPDISENISARIANIKGDVEIIRWLEKVAVTGRTRSVFEGNSKTDSFALPRTQGTSAFEVIGIPLKKPGFYVAELESMILGASLLGLKKPVYVPTSALVTNISAHFKWGKDSSLVWVTTLDGGEPVPNAEVTIRSCRGTVHWEGTTGNDGVAHIDKMLPSSDEVLACNQAKRDDDVYYDESQLQSISALNSGLFVFVKTKDDMTFVHSSWDRGIEPYRFKVSYESYSDGVFAHTVFDRTLFRAGDNVHMKHFARKRTKDGLSLPDQDYRSVLISHTGSNQRYTLPFKWNKTNGSAETMWTIPREAKLGRYTVYLVSGSHEEYSGEFRVEEFKIPIMKGNIKPPAYPLVNVSEVDIDLMVEYLAGGGANNLPIKLRTQIQPKMIEFDDYEDIVFSNGMVKEGITKREQIYEDVDSDEGEGDDEGQSLIDRKKKGIKTLELTLGNGGSIRTKIVDIPKEHSPQDILAELEFKDPNGETQTISKRITVWPSAVLVGIDADFFSSKKEMMRFKLHAVDSSGKPLEGVSIHADLFKKNFYSHRKRLVGGFYAYEHVTETKRIQSVCEGITNKQGIIFCEINTPETGNIIIQARASDNAGNVSSANRGIWITEGDDMWFDAESSDRIDLIPDKRRYEPGETAIFQVKMPMREATTLITVEREGIIDSFITKINSKNPIIKVPIKASYAPNVYISAFCIRGRTGNIKPSAMIDLGKPLFKLGITGVSVGWQANELKVNVYPDKKTYSTREKATFRIKVKTASGKPMPGDAEIAFAVVDDGLLELMPNKSWNILESMMHKRGYFIKTSTAQMQVIGRRHYGLKALPRGGGGGKQITRELFDTLLIWKGTTKLSEEGEAIIQVPLNDSLTSFTAVAVATAGSNLFGTGMTHIQTTQDLMVISGLPSVIREQDRFKASFTVRNTSKDAIDFEATAILTYGAKSDRFKEISGKLGAGDAEEISWDVMVPEVTDAIKWEVSVRDKNGKGQDSIRVTQKVAPVVSTGVVQATVTQLKKKHEIYVEQPKGATKDKGGIHIFLRPQLSGDTSGIVDYMKRYAYTCLEQKISKAISLQDVSMWQKIMSELPVYLDHEGLVKYFPTMQEGSDILTSYILSISSEAQMAIPGKIKEDMENALKAFIEGKIRRYGPIQRPDLNIRKLAAIEALAKNGHASASYIDSMKIEPDLLPTSAVLDWIGIIQRLKDLPNRQQKMSAAEQVIRARLNFQGTRMGFSTEKTDNLWWLMTGGDINSIRTIIAFLKDDRWKEDMPRLLRGAVDRQNNGRWNTTTANAWGTIMLKKFSESFEAEKISGISNIELVPHKQSLDWEKLPSGGMLSIKWPKSKTVLNVSHDGKGRPWATIQGIAAIPRTKPYSTGYIIKKIYTPVVQKTPGTWSANDVLRVTMNIEAQADMSWVVVNDPIPAGSSILGSGLGRDSEILAARKKTSGWVWPAFEERSLAAYRAYFDYVPKGKWNVEYIIRLNNSGYFRLPSTRVEALYAPEMFGEIPNGIFEIKQ